MILRKCDLFLLGMALNLALFAAMLVHAGFRSAAAGPQLEERARLVERLELTDLCLFTDARYARHPAMADLHTPFQDGPGTMEHFPSGTLIGPPPHLRPQ